MRKILALFIIFLVSTSVAFAMPDNLYNENNQTPIIYDASYNVALRNKLESQYDKKYKTCDDNGCVYNAPLDSYYLEVQVPYDRNKKPDNFKIINK